MKGETMRDRAGRARGGEGTMAAAARGAALAAFTLLAGATLAPAQGELTCGEAKIVDIAGSAQHVYTFQAQQDEVVWLNVQQMSSGPSGDFSVFSELYARDDLLGGPLQVIADRMLFFSVPRTSDYLLHVRDRSHWNAGIYGIGFERFSPAANQCGARTLHCGERVRKTLDRLAVDLYRYSGSAGDLVLLGCKTASRSPDAAFDIFGSLYGPDLQAPPLVDGLNGLATLTLPSEGVYTVVARDAGSVKSGIYEVSITGIDPFCDCNSNGTADGTDIASGTSVDLDGDLLPDECVPPAPRAWLEKAGDEVVAVRLESPIPFGAGEVALAWSQGGPAPVAVEAGADLPDGASVDASVNLPAGGCMAGTERGLTAAFVPSPASGAMLAAGTYEVLRIHFAETGDPRGEDVTLRFVDCLGPVSDPVASRITDELGRTVALASSDAVLSIQPREKPFRRGDVNDDGHSDVSDALSILAGLFLSARGTTCPDAADANDDGALDVSDAVYLLQWRFRSGPAPAAPASTCGLDPTADDLVACTQESCL